MSVNLQKGQKVDLTKGNSGLSKIIVGLGWDPVASSGKGVFGSIFGKSSANVDCDASVLMLDVNNKLQSLKDIVYFGKQASDCGSVKHSGDNLTGDGDGDDEQIQVDLSKIPAHIGRLVFIVNIYDAVNRKQHFGMIQNAFIRVFNALNNQELVKFNLTDKYSDMTALITGEIYRYNNEWKFAAIGEGTKDASIKSIAQKYM